LKVLRRELELATADLRARIIEERRLEVRRRIRTQNSEIRTQNSEL